MSRRTSIFLATFIALLLATALGWHLAAALLKRQIEEALGPGASVGSVSIGRDGLLLADVRIPAQRDITNTNTRDAWPSDDELRAPAVHVEPVVSSLFSNTWQARRVTVQGAYVSVLRSRDGQMHALPSLTEPAGSGSGRRIEVEALQITDASLDVYDASIRRPPHRVQLEQVQATIGPVHLPELGGIVQLEASGAVKGPQHTGRFVVKGSVALAAHDASLDIQLDGVDMLALQPWLLRLNDGGVKSGTLDLRMLAKVEQQKLRAPGSVTLHNVELAGNSLAGVPRQLVLSAMTRNGQVKVDFTLEGRLDDPKFSINESLPLKIAAGLAKVLGFTVGGVVEGIGSVIESLFGK
jgi:hypothetical protein